MNRYIQGPCDFDRVFRRHLVLPHPYGCSGQLEVLTEAAGEASRISDTIDGRVFESDGFLFWHLPKPPLRERNDG